MVFAAAIALVAVFLSRGDAPAYDSPSFYLREIRKAGLDVQGMHPYILSPQACDALGEHCPDEVELLAGADDYAEVIGPFVEALGAVAFPEQEGTTGSVARTLAREWEAIRSVARGPLSGQPLRVVLNHYSRKRDPGHCVTVRATFATAPDPLFDRKAAQALELPGALYMFWKTYQLDRGEPKLIEAGIEVTTDVRTFGWRRDVAAIAEPEDLPQTWTRDEMAGAHFYGFGGGRRYGVTWIDRGAGTKASDPWGAVYRMEHLAESDAPAVELAPLPEAWKTTLLEVIEKL